MIQGAGSDVGKSLIVAGLARAARRRGLRVLPFKPQNMSNNAAVTIDGGEIGRAQALQALAAGVEPHTDMNPVLLKPETDVGAQIIVQGRRVATLRARDYAAMKPSLMQAVIESFDRLRAKSDLVLVEGAGSPAEVNLRANDIANMGFARRADVPVVLVGDIDRGGVIAQLVGIKAVIAPEDSAMIGGFIINKFRGDPTLFDDGYALIARRTSWRGFGVLPYFARASELPAEDALGLADARRPGKHKIVCLALSRIATVPLRGSKARRKARCPRTAACRAVICMACLHPIHSGTRISRGLGFPRQANLIARRSKAHSMRWPITSRRISMSAGCSRSHADFRV